VNASKCDQVELAAQNRLAAGGYREDNRTPRKKDDSDLTFGIEALGVCELTGKMKLRTRKAKVNAA
jgi:hypothetical protein